MISFEWSAIFKAVVKRADEFPSVIQSRLENKSDEAKEAVPAAAITVVAELFDRRTLEIGGARVRCIKFWRIFWMGRSVDGIEHR